MGGKVSFGYEEVLPLYLAFFGMCVWVWISNARLKDTLTILANDLKDRLNAPLDVPSSFVEEIKDEMFNIVEDTLQNLSPPTAADHLMGTLSQLFQMKMMKNMELGNLLPTGDKEEDV